jgi:hypothetical protein
MGGGVRFLCIALGLAAAAPAVPFPAAAQDVPGIELCSRESRMDRRTGCLQSNVEYLQRVIAKNALDTQQKLDAANRDIVTLKDALAAVQARLDQMQKAKPDKK